MSNLNSALDRSRWFAAQNRHREALQYLDAIPQVTDGVEQKLPGNDSDRVSYHALFGSYRTYNSHGFTQAEQHLRKALELALKMGLPDDIFVWTTRYNLGLTLLLGDRARHGSSGSMTPTAQCERLNEAIGILGAVAQAFHAMPGPGYFRDSLGGRALALVAEMQYMLDRHDIAAEYAREAIPRLQPHYTQDTPGTIYNVAGRRLFGCYRLLLEIGQERPPGGGRYYNSVLPGTIGNDEVDDYVLLTMPYRPMLES